MSTKALLNQEGEKEIHHEFVYNELLELDIVIQEKMLKERIEMKAHGPQLSLDVQSLILRGAIKIVKEHLKNGLGLVSKALRKIQSQVYKETNVEK